MQFNGVQVNGVTVNGGLEILGAPTGRWYFAETLAKTDFSGFVSFLAPPVDLIDPVVPASTDMRFAFRFAAGGPLKVYSGSDWTNLVGAPDGAMTSGQVESLSPADMVATGGFAAATPYLQLVVYMRSDDAARSPSLSGVTYAYSQGSSATIVWANHFASPVPVAGGSPIPAGTYIWDTAAGYRLEDQATDNGQAITKRVVTQAVHFADAEKAIFTRIDVEVLSLFPTTMTVRPILDDVPGAAVTVAVQAGSGFYHVGIPTTSPAIEAQADIEWTDPNLVLRSVSFAAELSGVTKP